MGFCTALVAHEHGLEDGAREGFGVDAGVAFEAHVLGGDEGVNHVGRYLVEIGVHAVARASEIASHLLAVGSVDYGCELVLRVFQFLHGRHITYDAVIYEDEEDDEKSYAGYE